MFALTLRAEAYDIVTAGICGAPLDTRLEIFAADGTALGFDEDSGEGRAAALNGFMPPAAGEYTVRVTAYGASTGGYVIAVGRSE